MFKADNDEELISYYNNLAEEALDSSNYAETDEDIEECMSNYFNAKNTACMIDYVRSHPDEIIANNYPEC